MTKRQARGVKPKRSYSLVGVPTRALWAELERRESLAYARNVNREMRARRTRKERP